MTTALYLSPHPGDAALACAGGMLARAQARERVVVCSVFARTGDAELDRVLAAEDAAAMQRAGAEVIQLDLVAGHARLGDDSFRTLSLDAELDPELVNKTRAAIANVIARVQPDDIWYPLAIGNHIDHRIVFATRSLVEAPRFYEDRPYAFVPTLRALRVLELIGGRAKSADAAAIERELADGGCEAIVPVDVRGEIAHEIAARLRAHHAGEALAVETTVHRFASAELADACALVAAYATRTRELFGSARIQELWTRHASDNAGWIEREITLRVIDTPA